MKPSVCALSWRLDQLERIVGDNTYVHLTSEKSCIPADGATSELLLDTLAESARSARTILEENVVIEADTKTSVSGREFSQVETSLLYICDLSRSPCIPDIATSNCSAICEESDVAKLDEIVLEVEELRQLEHDVLDRQDQREVMRSPCPEVHEAIACITRKLIRLEALVAEETRAVDHLLFTNNDTIMQMNLLFEKLASAVIDVTTSQS